MSKIWLEWCVYVNMCICNYLGLCVRGCVYIYIYIYHFFSDLRDHDENKAFLLVLCYPSHCWCYSYLSAVIFKLQLLYYNFWAVCLFLCLLVGFFFVFFLRLIFRFNKFVSFLKLYLDNLLWFIFKAKWNFLLGQFIFYWVCM